MDGGFPRFLRPSVATITAIGWPYRLTLFMGVTLIGSFLSVLFHVTSIVGGSFWLGTVVVAAFGLGFLIAGVAGLRIGVAAIAAIFVLGLSGYLLAIPDLYEAIISLELVVDTVALLLGDMSLLQLFRADLWTIMMAPAPVYGTWFLLLRRRYGLSVWIGGAALLFVVLTGDASETVALIGATSALGVLGFGTLDRLGGSREQIREVGLLLVGVIILTRLTRPLFGRLFPRATGTAARGGTGNSQGHTLEGSLIDPSGRLDIYGSVSLSPAVRFTVAADEPGRWHVGAYDRFTGRGWVRTGRATPYTKPLPGPFGKTQTLEQRFTAESSVAAMPAAWQPVKVDGGVAARTQVTELGGIQVTTQFEPGETYSVTSERPVWTPQQLQTVEGAVTESIRRRYLQLPADTPDRIGRLAADLTRETPTRFDKALLIQRWLTATKGYSLDVSRPPGNIADAFIFEMDRGYCVYFATAMTVMLRTIDIPARIVVGYTTGPAVGSDRWEIRGLNSHAWVQVYFNQFGWVPFDPTPSGPRQAARNRRLAASGSSSGAGPTRGQSRRTGPTPTQSSAPALPSDGDSQPSIPTLNGPDGQTPMLFEAAQPSGTVTPSEESEPTGVTRRALFTDLSDSDRLAVLAGVFGVVLGMDRLGLLDWIVRSIRIHWQLPTDSPQQDIERAFERLEWVLAREHRARETNETRRAYIDSLRRSGVDDDRLRRILDRYEQARYQGDISRERAEEIIDLVDAYIQEHHSHRMAIQQILWGHE